MATIRHHARLSAPAGDVWAIVREPTGITDWLAGVDSCVMDGTARVVGTMGLEIREDILTVDDDLRRFQYSIVDSPLNLANHLSTVDILEDGDGCVVVYSTDVSPDEAGMILDAVAKGGVDALVERFG